MHAYENMYTTSPDVKICLVTASCHNLAQHGRKEPYLYLF